MSEWWTYRLSDFLMFSPQAYWRLVERHNAQGWPGQLLAQAAAIALLLLSMRRPTPAAWRASLALLAAAWAWVGWAFHWQRYAEIFLAAPWVAAACALQVLLLAGAALLPMPAVHASTTHWRRTGAILVAAAALYPLVALATASGWRAAEVFGFMPDPTALATLGVLVAMPAQRAWIRALLAVVPLLSLSLGLATRWLLA